MGVDTTDKTENKIERYELNIAEIHRNKAIFVLQEKYFFGEYFQNKRVYYCYSFICIL